MLFKILPYVKPGLKKPSLWESVVGDLSSSQISLKENLQLNIPDEDDVIVNDFEYSPVDANLFSKAVLKQLIMDSPSKLY